MKGRHPQRLLPLPRLLPHLRLYRPPPGRRSPRAFRQCWAARASCYAPVCCLANPAQQALQTLATQGCRVPSRCQQRLQAQQTFVLVILGLACCKAGPQAPVFVARSPAATTHSSRSAPKGSAPLCLVLAAMLYRQLLPKDLHRPTRSPRLVYILLCRAEQTKCSGYNNSATANARLAFTCLN